MSSKKIKVIIKLQVPGGKANPAPPVGPALGQHGVNIQDFVNRFNEKTKDKMGDILPVEITVFEDRSFTFILKTPPVAELIKKAIKLEKGSGVPNKQKVGKITKAQVAEIAKIKMPDVNAATPEAAQRIVEGTARSMGVDVIA